MLWAVYLTDKPDSASLRAAHMQTHKDYLHEVDARCFFTGPLMSDDGSRNIGSLWLISADSRAAAEAFVAAEPFFRAGVFASHRITRVRAGHFHPELVE